MAIVAFQMCIGKCLSAPETELGMPPAVYGPCVQPSGFVGAVWGTQREVGFSSVAPHGRFCGGAFAQESEVQRCLGNHAVVPVTAPTGRLPRLALDCTMFLRQDPKASPKASSTVPDGSVRQMAPQLEQMQQQLDTMTRHLQSLVQTKVGHDGLLVGEGRGQAQVPPPQQYPTYASSPRYLPATSQPPQATPRDHRWSSVATLPQQQQQQSPYPATDRPAKVGSTVWGELLPMVLYADLVAGHRGERAENAGPRVSAEEAPEGHPQH